MQAQIQAYFSKTFRASPTNSIKVAEVQRQILTNRKQNSTTDNRLISIRKNGNFAVVSPFYDRSKACRAFNCKCPFHKQMRQKQALNFKQSLKHSRKVRRSWHNSTTASSSPQRHKQRLSHHTTRSGQLSLHKDFKKAPLKRLAVQHDPSFFDEAFKKFTKQHSKKFLNKTGNKITFKTLKNLKDVYDFISKNSNLSAESLKNEFNKLQTDKQMVDFFLEQHAIIHKQSCLKQQQNVKAKKIPKRVMFKTSDLGQDKVKLPKLPAAKVIQKAKSKNNGLDSQNSQNKDRKQQRFIQGFMKRVQDGMETQENDLVQFKNMQVQQLRENCCYLQAQMNQLSLYAVKIIRQKLIVKTIQDLARQENSLNLNASNLSAHQRQSKLNVVTMKLQILKGTLQKIGLRTSSRGLGSQSKFNKRFKKISEKNQDEQQQQQQQIQTKEKTQESIPKTRTHKQNRGSALYKRAVAKQMTISIKSIKSIGKESQRNKIGQEGQQCREGSVFDDTKTQKQALSIDIRSTRFFNLQAEFDPQQSSEEQPVQQLPKPTKRRTVSKLRLAQFRRLSHLPFSYQGSSFNSFENRQEQGSTNFISAVNMQQLRMQLDQMAQNFVQQKHKIAQIQQQLRQDQVLKQYIVRDVDSLFTMRRKLRALKTVIQKSQGQSSQKQNKLKQYIQLVQKASWIKNRKWAQQRLKHKLGEDVIDLQDIQVAEKQSYSAYMEALLKKLQNKILCFYKIIKTDYQEDDMQDRCYNLICQQYHPVKTGLRNKFVQNQQKIQQIKRSHQKDDCLLQTSLNYATVAVYCGPKLPKHLRQTHSIPFL